MASEGPDNGAWEARFREDDEMDFFTDLALHETERWIQTVTRRRFTYPDDPRKSLQDGTLLCELLNCLRPASVKRINRQATPIAGLDNLNVFLSSLRTHFGLLDTHLFDAADLEDLSQRAIAESDQLKQEVDRRLRNVAITVYWLGKSVSQSFQGPQLDLSAFAPLVHHHSKDIISNEQLRRDSSCSWDSTEHSSAYDSHDSKTLGIISEDIKLRTQDTSYESYASYDKRSEDSLDEHSFDTMPSRYGSQSGLNKSGDGLYPDDRQHTMYRSSPDLSLNVSHRRSSSNDSLDGSYHGSHSRQSSGSGDNYPTRPQRRTSSSTADPLQFVKFHRQTELAKQAEEQIKLAATQKEHKVVVKEEKEDDDWLSNLTSWKSRRKSQSSAAYQLKEELEAQEEEPEVKTSLQTKTFSQMQQERERRKSGSTRNFYPLEENDDESDVVSPTSPAKQDSSQDSKLLYKSNTVADWADDSDEEKEDNNNNNNVSKDKENGMNEDPFDDPASSPRNKPSPAKRRSGAGDSERSERSVLARRNWEVHENVSKQNSRNSQDTVSKTNKISDIRNRFEHTDEHPKVRSSTVDTKVDLKARLKSFESDEAVKTTTRSNRISSGYTSRSDNPSEGDSVSESVTMETYSRSYSKASPTSSPSRTNEQSSSRNLYSSLRTSGRDYTEKTIKISQKANSEKGFGLSVTGGADTQEPVRVLKVSLGSAADVCEVLAKDEILSINKCDISRNTNAEVKQLIQDAVKSGQLELRVKRFLGSHDELDDDEFLSSDEEVESLERSRNSSHHSPAHTHHRDDSQDSRTSKEDFRAAVNNNPVASALDEERQWLNDQLDYGESVQQSEGRSEGVQAFVEDGVSEVQTREDEPTLETQSSITGQQRSAETSTQPLHSREYRPSVEEKQYEVKRHEGRTSENEGSSSGDDFGPPAILRKWQRQRPQSEYTFEREKSPDKRLSSSLPWMDNKLDNRPDHQLIDDPVMERASEDLSASQPSPPVPSPRRRFDDHKKQEEWNQRHEQMRQPTNTVVDSTQHQEEFQFTQSRMQQDYHAQIERAQELAKHRQEQEREMLEPEMERMRITEERRLERRMRQQQLQQSNNMPGEDSSSPSFSNQQSAHQNKSALTFQVQGQGQDQGRPGMLVIDPRNRGDDDYKFHVNIGQVQGGQEPVYIQPVQSTQSAYQPSPIDIEAIREEERRKIREEERQRREEEEDRRFREKEAQLREQEELLRRKEEQLRQEQERFHREQEQLHNMPQGSEQRNVEVMRFDAPVSRVREASPSYQSVVTKKRPEVLRSSTAPHYSTTVVVEPKPQYSVKSVSSSMEAIRSSTDPSGRSRYSREDMMAMNRKATPLQARPDTTPPTSPTGAAPIKRTTLSREQVHSLNAVPKPRFRSNQDWIGNEQPYSQRGVPSRHSDIMKKQFATPQEHWLFEEAERRRRMASQDPAPHSRQSSHSQFTGPIKPTAENRWREEPLMDRQSAASLNTSFDTPRMEGNMPAAIRQTLLQKTAGARGSTGSSYSQDLGVSYNQFPNQSPSLSQTLPANYSYNNQSYAGPEQAVPPSFRAPAPHDPSPAQSMPLSGRQLCSHCNQELGFGAAMIIESLGLSYHVQCFKCCVCHTPLGNGNEGADVRVRVNKLHCPNCYSNDEAGLKFSKV